MIDRRQALLATLGLVAAFGAVAPARAGEPQPYDQAAFDKALATGRPILLHITAPWCPTCKAQKPILAEMRGKAKFAALTQFDIDFDSQKNLLRKLGVQSQSTLITFRAGKEKGRSVGDTNPDSIEDLLNMAI